MALTEKEYKAVCEQIDYEQEKYNRKLKEWRIIERGMSTVINALQEQKDQFEMSGGE